MSNPTVAELTGGTYMRTARRQIPYVMLHRGGQSFHEKVSPSLANSSYAVLVDWDQANDFLVDVIGQHTNSGSAITRYNPEPHAFWPGLYCIDAELAESLGEVVSDADVAGALSYDYGAYTLTFAPLTYDLGTDADAQRNGEITRYVTRPPSKMVGESIQLSNGQLIFPYGSDNVTAINPPEVIATPPTYKSSYIEFTLIHELVPEADSGGLTNILAKAIGMQNCVNAVPFGVGGKDPAMTAGTVLYLGIGERERIPWSIGGTVLWRIPHHFVFRPQGWNTALRMCSAASPPAMWSPTKAQAYPTGVSTTITAASNGATLPQATINVGGTGGFATSGQIAITLAGGVVQIVTYTGTTPTTFTGCTGGVKTLATGNSVAPFITWDPYPSTYLNGGSQIGVDFARLFEAATN